MLLRHSFMVISMLTIFLAVPSSIVCAEDQAAVGGHSYPIKVDKVDKTGPEDSKSRENSLREKPKIGHRMEGAFLEGEDLHETMLAGVRLRKAKLKSVNLRKAMLAGADLRQANLEHADLHSAMLLGANLSGANLTNANFEEAMLWGAQLEGARIDGANFKNALVSQDQIDDACGRPDALPLGVKMPKPC